MSDSKFQDGVSAFTSEGGRVARLRELDACAVSDAFDRLGLTGVVTGVPQRSGSRRIAGRTITLRLHAGPPPPGPRSHLGTRAIEAGDGECVIVIEQTTGIDAGCWGGILTLAAVVRGIAGVIADGPVRDIDEAATLDFPVFSTSLTTLTARGRINEFGTNVPICVWGVQVHADDYVIADRSGIAFIPSASIDTVLDEAEAIVARERDMATAVRQGIAISEVMDGQYEDMVKKNQAK